MQENLDPLETELRRMPPSAVPPELMARLRAAGAEPVIGTVAALRPEKNLPRLLRAFRLVADVMPARLVIAGDGPERPGLERLTSELGLSGHVCFTGYLDDPAALYRSLDVFALSSDTEQMPLSVIEAMASALPVAATDVGDVAAMLAPENQAFVTAVDETELAGAIMALARDATLRARVGAANRTKAEAEFDQAGMDAAWGALFDGAAAPAMTGRFPTGGCHVCRRILHLLLA